MRNLKSSKVTILCPAATPSVTLALKGIRSYAHTQEDWHLISSPPSFFSSSGVSLDLQFMHQWTGSGIITSTASEEELLAIRKMKIPAVNILMGHEDTFGIPRVVVNDHKVGRLAAEHLLSRGLRSMAFLGRKVPWFSHLRHRGFAERLAEVGLTPKVFLQGPDKQTKQAWLGRVDEIARWAASLPRPTGIFAVHDYRAQLLLDACHVAGLNIPEDIAVVGVDNDESICDHSIPSLSSVACNQEKIGWEAAALLSRMLKGEKAPRADFFVEPDRVVARQSTDRLYCSDPATQRALDLMSDQIGKPFNIEELAEQVGVSKRTLETRFRDHLASSPHEYLTKMRVQRAQVLMSKPGKRTIERTAVECGFGSVSAFYGVFKRFTGESPARFRKKQLAAQAEQPGGR
jgi:LacI family transcriptional regulator